MNHLQHRAESLIPLVSDFSEPQSRWVGEIDMSLFAGFPIMSRRDRRVIAGHQPIVTGDLRLGAGSMAIRGLDRVVVRGVRELPGGSDHAEA
jgi:hypothetical protein